MSSAPAANKADSPEQKEIEAIWKEVQAKVIQLAGGNPRSIQPMTIDGVLAILDASNEATKKAKADQEKFAWIRLSINGALKCLQTVGGIVSTGVSTVFAPASMCYNALSFVITAWQGYEGMFVNLAELMAKCTEFLDRLDYYNANMDTRLTRLACQNLQLFVNICDRAIRLRKKHTRFLAFTKQLFLQDDGIGDLLGMMDRLNKKESLLVSAQTFKIVSNSADDIKIVAEGHKEQVKKEDARERRKAIIDALGFRGTEVTTTGDPLPSWQKAFDTYRNALIDTTGDWIQKDPRFLEWATAATPSKPLLILEGKAGSGKTLLMANVVRYLRKQGQSGPTSRNIASYFFPQADSKGLNGNAQGQLVERLSRELLWQIASAFDAMTKSVAQRTQELTGADGQIELWQRLFVKNPERLNKDSTFFILIDGMQDNMRQILPLLRTLLSATDQGKTRILLTAEPDVLSTYFGRVEVAGTEVIRLADQNSSDIEKYINYRLDGMSTFRDASRGGIAEWRSRIVSTLATKCEGDYFKLSASLDALDKVDLVEDIEEVLEDAGKTRSDQIEAEIRRLNETRTPKEIQEMNDITLWVSTGRLWFAVQTLESLLAIQRQASSSANAGGPSTAISLLPFAKKLAEKYTLFAVSESNLVRWRNPEAMDMIPVKHKAQDQSSSAALTVSGSKGVQEAEVNIVRHFLNNVCPPDLYNRFEFEKFLESKLGAQNKDYISQDPDNAHIKIVIVYLSVLTDAEKKFVGDLRDHARNDLFYHMKKVDFTKADQDLRSHVGPLLVKLLTEKVGVASLFLPEKKIQWNISRGNRQDYINVRAEWVYSMEGVQEVARWFGDACVTKLIQERDDATGKAFMAGIQDGKLDLHEAVLSKAAKILAAYIFHHSERPWETVAASLFLRGYLMRQDPVESAGMHDEASVYIERETAVVQDMEVVAALTPEMAGRIEEFAAEALDKSSNTPSQDSIWEFRAHRWIRRECPSISKEKAILRIEKALELDENNIPARCIMAMRCDIKGEDPLKAMNAMRNDVDSILGYEEGTYAAQFYAQLGNRIWDEDKEVREKEGEPNPGRREEAVQLHMKSLTIGFLYDEYSANIKRYLDAGEWAYVIQYLDGVHKARDIWKPRADELAIHMDNLTDYGSRFAKAADEVKGGWDVMETFWLHLIQCCVDAEIPALVYFLRSRYGVQLSLSKDAARARTHVSIFETALSDMVSNSSIDRALSKFQLVPILVDLSSIYWDDVAQLDSPDEETIQYHADKITGLMALSEKDNTIMFAVGPICSLLRLQQKFGYHDPAFLKDWTRRIMLDCIEILSDEDEDNDIEAHLNLWQLTKAMGDAENCRISVLLLRWSQHLLELGEIKLRKQEGTGNVKQPEEEENEKKKEEVASWVGWMCDACQNGPRYEDMPSYNCLECGDFSLCVPCYTLLQEGKPLQYASTCRADHQFVYLPAWDKDTDLPPGSVPRVSKASGGPKDSSVKIEGSKPMDEWLEELRAKYLEN